MSSFLPTAGQPLRRLRILDLTRLVPGPYATRLLAELGAEVIKIEDPQGGDYVRWYPPLTGEPPVSGIFRELNAGKKSVCLDLRRPEAKQAFHLLLKDADVLVDSFRPGVLDRLDLSPKRLAEAHPRLIYCAITGFGLTGPDRDRAGHDLGYMARAGGIALSGPEEPGPPFVLGVQAADIGGALAAVAGILAALFERQTTGKGRVVDIALAEAGLAFNTLNFGLLHAGATPRRGAGTLDGSRPCYTLYRAACGGYLAVGALEPKFWRAFLTAIGLPSLETSALDGGSKGTEARRLIQDRLLTRTRDEWTALFKSVDACVEPVLHPHEVEQDEHFAARHVVREGFVRSPIRLASWDDLEAGHAACLDGAPELGADTERVLRAAGAPPELIEALTNVDVR